MQCSARASRSYFADFSPPAASLPSAGELAVPRALGLSPSNRFAACPIRSQSGSASRSALSASVSCGLLAACRLVSLLMSNSPKVVVPPEPELPYRACYPHLEHHATALGYVCINIGHMEFVLHTLLELLLRVDQNECRAVIDATGASIATRCDLIRKLASMQKPNGDWFDAVDAVMSCIERDILPLRNRYVHDRWVHREKPILTDSRAFLKRPQSHLPKALTEVVESYPDLADVWALVEKIESATHDIATLYAAFIEPHRVKPNEAIPLRALPHRKMRPPSDLGRQAPSGKKGPPQPSDPSQQSDDQA